MNRTHIMADVHFDHQGGATCPTPYHRPPQPVALGGRLPCGTHGGRYGGRPEQSAPAMALEGGPPHPGCPAQAPYLDDPDRPSPRASRPEMDHGAPAPAVKNLGPPRKIGAHQHLAEPLQPTPPTVHNRAPSGCWPSQGWNSAVSTPREWRLGSYPPGGQNSAGGPWERRVPGAKVARRPLRRNGWSSTMTADGGHGGSSGRQRRQMSTTENPQRRIKMPRLEQTKMLTILPSTG